jgi:pyridinium-3,5-biscarboxylic acid mononucleotide sulfurtransferase
VVWWEGLVGGWVAAGPVAVKRRRGGGAAAAPQVTCPVGAIAVASRRARHGPHRDETREPGGLLDDGGLAGKHGTLIGILEDCGSVCIGYSGGVDSVFLARCALDALGPARVLAVTGRSPSYAGVQRAMALACAEAMGLPHVEIRTHEMASAGYVANAPSRCYFCKDELWSRLGLVARERGLRTVIDGANADDAADHRPGARAAREHGVRSPLQEAGLTKAEIRALSRQAGLPTWDEPASPCLASRLAYGLAVTPERLAQVEAAEVLVRGRGLREFRVRHHGDVARIEVSPAELDLAAAAVGPVVAQLRSLGFQRVLLDVEGYRRGALNEGLVELAVS